MQPIFSIFHFNDVYDIQPDTKEPKGGAAYFQSLLHSYKSKCLNALTLFSGDAFAPSLLSSQFQGTNMIQPLNSFGIDAACLGNHDFDYALPHVLELLKQTNFPWMLSNVYNKTTQRRLGQALQYTIFERGGLKIGIFSLAQPQWLDTLYQEYYDIVEVIPFIQVGEHMVQVLKRQQKCDILIALTHMMKYNDIKLAQALPEVDLILGGHDHLILHQLFNNSVLVKSGTNFKYFSSIDVFPLQTIIPHPIQIKNKSWLFGIELVEVNHQKHKIIPNQQLNTFISHLYKQFAVKQSKIAMYSKSQIDLLFKTIRKEQNSFLEFIASFYRHYSHADCAFLNSGNFRIDCKIPPGPITFGELSNIIEDNVVVKVMNGQTIIKGLQNMVSMYPNLSGRFSALSGMIIFHLGLQVASQPTDISRNSEGKWRACCVGEGVQGSYALVDVLWGDGYACFKDCPKVVDHEHRKNLLLIHDLLNPDCKLVETFIHKYPKLVKVIEIDGQKYLELDLQHPKNVKMLQ